MLLWFNPAGLLLLSSMMFLPQVGNLHVAVAEGNLETVQVYVGGGANVNATIAGGMTPLMIAAKYGRTQIIDYLANNRAAINRSNSAGNTALMIAVSARRLNAVRTILKYQPNTVVKNREGLTALDIARLLNLDRIATAIENFEAQRG